LALGIPSRTIFIGDDQDCVAEPRAPQYAWDVLNKGVCDGCALGTTGMKDWTLDGTHLCLVRLNLLRLNTMDAFDPTSPPTAPPFPRKRAKISARWAV